MSELNETHDPRRRSWIESANRPDTDFPIQNLPLGVFSRGDAPRCGVAIGDCIFDIAAAYDEGLFTGRAAEAAKSACQPTLNSLMDLGSDATAALRARISDLLLMGGNDVSRVKALGDKLIFAMTGATLKLPFDTRNFTDFLTSVSHTERAGRLKGLAVPVPPAYHYVPVAYHSRATSIVLSGTPVRRPYGQWKDTQGKVRFGPSESLDYELELGLIMRTGNTLGVPIPVEEAEKHFFGYCLLNDWSTKEIQWWEQVLGPFLGKSFMTSISPWIVTAEALAPFKTPAAARSEGTPAPLPYLYAERDQREGGMSIDLDVYLHTSDMREKGIEPTRITKTGTQEMYWTFAQMVAHHTVNGCNLKSGDILASGTLSGLSDESRACLAEITMRGNEPLTLVNGEQRAWLEDGDEIIFRGRAKREGYISLGFGECRGRVEGNVIGWLDEKRVGYGNE